MDSYRLDALLEARPTREPSRIRRPPRESRCRRRTRRCHWNTRPHRLRRNDRPRMDSTGGPARMHRVGRTLLLRPCHRWRHSERGRGKQDEGPSNPTPPLRRRANHLRLPPFETCPAAPSILLRRRSAQAKIFAVGLGARGRYRRPISCPLPENHSAQLLRANWQVRWRPHVTCRLWPRQISRRARPVIGPGISQSPKSCDWRDRLDSWDRAGAYRTSWPRTSCRKCPVAFSAPSFQNRTFCFWSTRHTPVCRLSRILRWISSRSSSGTNSPSLVSPARHPFKCRTIRTG